MAWIRKDERTWVQKLCANVLSQGPLPKHVGFILDGNRRFAKKLSVEKIEGHSKGFEKLADTLRWCLDFGIREVTVYVFSIENFKRPPEEVDGLMKLATEKFTKLLEEKDKLMEEGVCVQIIGDWSLVPPNLRKLMAKAMVMTRHNRRAKLNVAFAYTSRNEIARAVESLHWGIKNGDLLLEDFSEDLFAQSFQILPSQPLDLLIRTSGETRLSDFLLWQSSESVICFDDVLWPEFTFWHLMATIFHYQINYLSMKKLKFSDKTVSRNSDREIRQKNFIEKLRNDKWNMLENEAGLM